MSTPAGQRSKIGNPYIASSSYNCYRCQFPEGRNFLRNFVEITTPYFSSTTFQMQAMHFFLRNCIQQTYGHPCAEKFLTLFSATSHARIPIILKATCQGSKILKIVLKSSLSQYFHGQI